MVTLISIKFGMIGPATPMNKRDRDLEKINKLNLSGENRNFGPANGRWKGGANLVGWFSCPKCSKPRLTQKKASKTLCLECYRSRGRTVTADQMKENQKAYAVKYKGQRALLKDLVIKMYDGRCYSCSGSFDSCVYEFHHLDPRVKDKNPSSLFRQSNLESLYKELRHCIMLCCNCHRSAHWGSLKIDIDNAKKFIDSVWNNRASLTYT